VINKVWHRSAARFLEALLRFGPVLLLLLAGCQTGPVLKTPEIDAASWNIRRGQAIWRSGRDAPQIAGDLMVATRSDGESVVQFTKTPFPTVIAQSTTARWQVQFFPQNRTITGRGRPPGRFVWFQLPPALAGSSLAAAWKFRRNDNGWRLENDATGESLEGYLTP
jgi:hypothetical protein